jgi:hypothetical protein
MCKNGPLPKYHIQKNNSKLAIYVNVLISFPSLWQNIWENLLKGRKLILAHSFRGFSPWPLGSLASGPAVEHNIRAERVDGPELLVSWKEREGMEERLWTRYSPHGPILFN